MNGRLEEIREELSKLRNESFGKAFIAIQSKRADEAVIEANAEGLIVLAAALMTLAASGKEGSHFNFDSSTGAYDADLGIVFSRVSAPWEKN